jgi:hypothetical protein
VRISLRSGVRERPRHDPLGPGGGDLRDGSGDRARGGARSRS